VDRARRIDDNRRPVSVESLESLRARVEAHLSQATHGAASVASIDRLAGGACQDNFALVARIDGAERRMVLRSDAASSLPGSLDRAREHDVIRAAAAAGVRTPEARWLARDLVSLGKGAYFMDWVEGEAIGRRVVGSPKLAAAREKLPAECARELARIHAITPATHPDLFPPGSAWGDGEDPAQSAIDFAHKTFDALKEPRPALELALRWLSIHRPKSTRRVLVHGDFRTGNLMVTTDGLAAVLDWEFAHWGSPAEDVAWLCVRDWRFGQLKLAAGGFAPRQRLYDEIERVTAEPVDRAEVHWWEVMGNVRWSAASLHQGERYLSGVDPDIELIAVARRAIEMEYEALRLMEVGPRGVEAR
jgi:aminoglycoside phosphotransferase (APT) family kinase protein